MAALPSSRWRPQAGSLLSTARVISTGRDRGSSTGWRSWPPRSEPSQDPTCPQAPRGCADDSQPMVNPRAVAAWSASGLLIVILSNNPAYRTLVLLAALNFVVANRPPRTRLRPLPVLVALVTLMPVMI